MIPLSLYVHLPWCVRKCPYCDFNSHVAGESPPKARYLDALLRDIEFEGRRAAGRPLTSVFLGGGTPSLFTPGEIARLLGAVRRHFPLAPDVEITLEANPGTVECGAPAGYRAAGVNRLSIGAQSFSDAMLKRLGRIHSAADIRRAVAEAAAAGFDSFNVDIMYGLPGQDVESALQDLEVAAALEPPHLSWYQLTLEPNTRFFARPPADLPDEDTLATIEAAGRAFLAGRGFGQYEVSAWAAPGHRCRHNLNYWTYGDYLAAGAGAHGKLTGPAGIYRYRKPANPVVYMQTLEAGEPAGEQPRLGAADVSFEFLMNALRLSEGFDESLYAERTGLGPGTLERAARPAVEKGLLGRDPAGRWRPTALGERFLDELTQSFLP